MQSFSEIDICDLEKCSGCGVCALVCPKECIKMVSNDEGFLYPNIDGEKCIKCGVCKKSCSLQYNYENGSIINAYGACSLDQNVLLESSSGGFFSIISEYVIKNAGVVYGASLNANNEVEHDRIVNIEELFKLRGSKYVQSNAFSQFNNVKNDLNSGILVLFSGTPCQVAALKNYLNKDFENLITIDLVCHGVPSPIVWKKYVKRLEEKYHANAKTISFRNKKHGWEAFSLQIIFSNGREYRKRVDEDPFLRAFLQNTILRKSCYNCTYKVRSRKCDYSLADYWGGQMIDPDIFNPKGTSLVLVHSIKGEKYLAEISSMLNMKSTNAQAAMDYNVAIDHSAIMPSDRDDFFNDLRSNVDIKKIFERYDKESKLKRILRFIKHKIS